jgi:outer membrane receptor protein involved in Fe transport
VNSLGLDVSAGIDNVFNVAYETLRAYAMPGRVYRLSLTVSFHAQKPNSTEIKLD